MVGCRNETHLKHGSFFQFLQFLQNTLDPVILLPLTGFLAVFLAIQAERLLKWIKLLEKRSLNSVVGLACNV